MKEKSRQRLLLSAILALMAAPCGAQETAPITVEQAQRAINAHPKIKAMALAERPKIAEVLGCIPASAPKGSWVCPVQIANRDHINDLTFRNTEKGWELLEEEGTPACAPLPVEEKVYRQVLGDKSIHVTGEVDDGEGLFTDERGMMRNKKGPYRLMCRYEVATSTNPDALFITYIWHDGENYIVDHDWERW